jgi:hypothetical protein
MLANALYAFLAVQAGGTSRRFFRLNGFDDAIYAALLERLRIKGGTLAGQPLWVRTTAPLPGYEDYTLEPDKSATWYRNRVPIGYALVLIFNRPTSDAQSLKDVYPITESLLATEGLDHLIRAAFATYQPSPEQVDTVRGFLKRLRPFPQLRDVAEFLNDLNVYLHAHPGANIEMAIAESLPALGFFRCRKLADALNTTRGDELLRNVQRAARLGSELLDDRQRDEYLSRLDETEFDDDSAYGGLRAEEKRALLYHFLTEVVTDRRQLLNVLCLDWREIEPVLHKSRRKSRSEQLKSLASDLQKALPHNSPETLSEAALNVLSDLSGGKEPEYDNIERFLSDDGDSLPRSIRNQLRRLRGVKKHQTTDFIAGVTFLSVEILTNFRDDLPTDGVLSVRREGRDGDAQEAEALLAFRTLYGGIETAMPGIQWELNDLLARVQETIPDREGADDEREKIIKTDVPFRVTLTNSQGQVLATAELVWHYCSDSPAAATLSHLQAEAQCLAQQDDGPLFQTSAPRLRIPAYNTCPAPDEVSDLDISRPLSSLGAWYRAATDLGGELREALKQATSKEALSVVNAALVRLEVAWAAFVKTANARGILAADLDALLADYEGLLTTAAQSLKQGQEVLHGFRCLVQAWMIGPETFDEWAVMPLLHPLKLHWHRARARRFARFLSELLSDNKATQIVDVRRFRQELTITYSSASYPALVALPGRDRRPVYFLPVHEIQGYELFRREGKASLAYGLDPDLTSEDESEEAAKVAATELARVVQDYIETYPFARDGLEIYLVQCRNGALPGLLVEELDKLIRRRQWSLRLDVVVHSTDRGASLYRRVTEWLKAHEEFAARPDSGYFPLVALRVLECEYNDLFQQLHDADLVILPDVLAEKGQSVEAEMFLVSLTTGNKDEWPLYRAQQAPFERGEFIRTLFLTPQPQPKLLRHFYCIQWAAKECKALPADKMPHFFLKISLLDWEQSLTELHRRFNWVVCYDTTVDRFLLEATFPETIEVIRYSSGLGAKRRHNLTVSSSHRSQDVVISRLTVNVESLLPGTPNEFRRQVAQRLVEQAKQVSGDIVLRAAGPGAFLNELIGMVVAKHETERRYLEQHPGALMAWIYLDDFAHWFDGRIPDLLFVAIRPEVNDELLLHIELLETKCVGESNFAVEDVDAQRQVAQGVNRLAQALAPGARHLDAAYWYDQLYRAVAGNLVLEHNQVHLWESFRRCLPTGSFILEISGHAWIFCYDSSLGIASRSDEGDAAITAPDAPGVPHRYHHFGRAGLRRLLRNLVEAWELPAPVETWSADYDLSPASPVPQSAESPQTTSPIETALPVSSESIPRKQNAPSSQPLNEWCEQRARNLTRALNSYSIQVYPIQANEADVGPGVVRFKARLRPGEKLNRLQAIAPDLQRDLALMAPPLIDNVRGTNFVGIDLPHPQPQTLLLLPELSNLPHPDVSRLPFLVGKTPDGRPVVADLADLPHLLVAGSTGSGKTIFLYSLLLSLVHHHSPNELLMLLVDPKQTDFVYFDDLPYLLGGKVVIDPNDAINWLDHLATDMLDHRSQQLRNARCRDIHDYNARRPEAIIAPLVVVIDEYADLVQVLNKSDRQSFEQRLVRLAQRARNVGIHLVIATQRPSADIVTTSLKTNLPARVAFRLPSHHDSMIILDRPGAENLLGRGDMLFANQQQIERLQGFYVSSADLEQYLQRFANPLK